MDAKGETQPSDVDGLQVDGLSNRNLTTAATSDIMGPLGLGVGFGKAGDAKAGEGPEEKGYYDPAGDLEGADAPRMENEMAETAAAPVPGSPESEVEKVGGCFGGFIWLVVTYPFVLFVLVPLLAFLIIGPVGIPPYPAFIEGNRARNSLGARQFDAYTAASDDWLDQVSGNSFATSSFENQEFAPYTQEVFGQSINVWFESESGTILSEKNVASQLKILSGFSTIVGPFCQQASETDPTCKLPASIFSTTGTTTSEGVKAALTAASDVEKDRWKAFLGANTDFSGGTGFWTKSRVRVGGPLPGYKNASHLEDEQAAVYEAEYKRPGFTGLPTPDGWIAQMDELVDAEAKANPDLKVRYASFPMIGPVFFQALLGDALLSIGALFAVGIIIWVQVGSVMIAVCSMFQIVIAFVLTLSTWRLIGNESFTFIQVLVIFIILGIGADDVFVFMDAWKQSRTQPNKVSGSLHGRLQWTWARAFAAMLVTTTTTIGALCLTSIIDVPSIATFGTFAAIVVFWNFFFCVVWLPCVVIIHEKYVVRGCNDGCCAKRTCGCCCSLCTSQWGLEEGAKPAHGSEDELRGLEKFFKYTLFNFLMTPAKRYSVFATFVTLAVVGIALASTGVHLTDKSLTESFLKDSSDIQQMFNLLTGNSQAFSATSDGRKRAGHIVYGIDKRNPIDRSGTYALGEGDQIGEPLFRAEADLNSAAFQTHLVETCDLIKELPSVARRVADKSPESLCFMSDFKAYREAKGASFPTSPDTLVADLMAWRGDWCTHAGCYHNRQGTGVSDLDDNYDLNTGFLVEGDRIKFAYVSGNLTIPYLEQELSVIEPEYDEWTELGNKQNKDGFEPFGMTDRSDWIMLMHTLINGVVSGVPVALCVAGGVLVLATGNVWVSLVATMTIVGVMSCFFITFVATKGKLGYYECMFLQITVGMSVDYVVHLAHSYNQSPRYHRHEKMQDSLGEMGISVFSGAITTLAASGLLFGCQFNIFFQYGSFIFFVILWSILWAMIFFPALMIQCGPNGRSGDIKPIRWLHKQVCMGMGDDHPAPPPPADGKDGAVVREPSDVVSVQAEQ
eukprot:CAMPEP_0173391900 /NCGR_PEP_ID=MMETSP1356-20130122/18644_1 /TAXON_ID=77927 ORGANISM="Hemiselmis virescens, Strain PCC157" /NCGR_SAMPLE_ID=MMETSP1356 /ASSEMBLY_ACC=CAM_ASM_000847 /LENGTH=1071 /DNA_ID=CAMNT_0014349593 /DNA_START=39 /DNA_END=3254 /DNA_ORIENTATION=-